MSRHLLRRKEKEKEIMSRLNRNATVIDGLIKCGILEGNKDRNELRPTVDFLCLLYKQKGNGPVLFGEYAENEVVYFSDAPETKQMREYFHNEVRYLIADWIAPIDLAPDETHAETRLIEDQAEIVCELIHGIINRREEKIEANREENVEKLDEEILTRPDVNNGEE